MTCPPRMKTAVVTFFSVVREAINSIEKRSSLRHAVPQHQEAAAAKAEAKLASLARENVEVAVKELGRLLEFAREAAAVKADNHDGVGRYEKDSDRPLRVTALRDWDRPEDDNRRFARVMVRERGKAHYSVLSRK